MPHDQGHGGKKGVDMTSSGRGSGKVGTLRRFASSFSLIVLATAVLAGPTAAGASTTGSATTGAAIRRGTTDPAPYTWSWKVFLVDPAQDDQPSALSSVSCPSASLCAAVDTRGNVVVSDDPTVAASWVLKKVDTRPLVAVSCPSTTLCVGVDSAGNVSESTDPTGAASTWHVTAEDVATHVSAISCPTSSLCVGVSYSGDVIASTDPTGPASSWTTRQPAGAAELRGVSCTSSGLCVAVGSTEQYSPAVFTSTDPTGSASAWKAAVLGAAHANPVQIDGVSCPSSAFCVAVTGDGFFGYAFTSTDPTGPASGWVKTSIASPSAEGVSCASATLCTVVGPDGTIETLTEPSGQELGYTVAGGAGLIEAGPDSVACPTPQLCVAVDIAGEVIVGQPLPSPIVAMAATPDGKGYYLAAADGTVYALGDAHRYGDLAGKHLNAPIVGMTVDSSTGGYWLLGGDGGVFSFHAPFYGSLGNKHLNRPVVGITSTTTGNGYRIVASDGGIFDFGPGARFYGSTGAIHLNEPVVGMAGDPATGGYWLVAADGGVFSFHAPFFGSAANYPGRSGPIIAIVAVASGNGYRIVGDDFGEYGFGSVTSTNNGIGSTVSPVVSAAAEAPGDGYWLVQLNGVVTSDSGAVFYGNA
jgi:hypothetical protein